MQIDEQSKMNEDVTAFESHFGVYGEGGGQQRQMKTQHALLQSPSRPTAGPHHQDTENPQKKIKLEIGSNAAATTTTPTPAGNQESIEDLSALKRRILDHKYMRLRSLKEKYSEHVAELFFLQSGGNMMEYPTWRKKQQSPQFITFFAATSFGSVATG